MSVATLSGKGVILSKEKHSVSLSPLRKPFKTLQTLTLKLWPTFWQKWKKKFWTKQGKLLSILRKGKNFKTCAKH